MFRGFRRKQILFAALGLGAVIIVAAIAVPFLAWPDDGFPVWGHPQEDAVLVGSWHGTYDLGSGSLVLGADHTFVLQSEIRSVDSAETRGEWSYSSGELRLSPGLVVVYDTASDTLEYEQRSFIVLNVGNTIWPWLHSITSPLEEGTLLYNR
jgi:hypothetical protein